MGRKNKNTSFNQRQLVIFHYEKNKTIREIGQMLNISKSTVYDIVKRYKKEDRIESIPQKGRPKLLSRNEERWIINEIRENPKISAPKLTTKLKEIYGKTVSVDTVRNVIRSNGYHGRTPRKKPYINDVNRKKRVDFCKLHLNKSESFWNTVLFTDESKFNVFGSDGKGKVWRKANEELNIKNLTSTVKHGGGSVLVWGCMAASGVGNLVFIDGIMDKNVYLGILRDNLNNSTEKLGISDCFSFYQDNDPKHKAHVVKSYLLYNCPKVLETPPQSPDINPIENLWEELDRRVRKQNIRSKIQLKRVLEEEWKKIEPNFTQNLVNSIPRRLQAVLKQKVYPTKY